MPMALTQAESLSSVACPKNKSSQYAGDAHDTGDEGEYALSRAGSDATEAARRVSATNTIVRFLRKARAAKCYGDMFSSGTNYPDLGLAVACQAQYGNSAIKHLDTVSTQYLHAITRKVGNISDDESQLLERIKNLRWHFRHQTNANISGAQVNLLSNRKLNDDNIDAANHTTQNDRTQLSNDDFVYFATEFSNQTDKIPKHNLHSGFDYGAFAVIIDDEYPSCEFGYITLTDHLKNIVDEHRQSAAQQHFCSFFPGLEVSRMVSGGKGAKDVPIFSFQHMKAAVGLHLIDFLRLTNDAKFARYLLSPRLSDESLDRALNLVFQVEFHIPRMLGGRNLVAKRMRKITLADLIDASRVDLLDDFLANSSDAYEIIKTALTQGKAKIVDHVLANHQRACGALGVAIDQQDNSVIENVLTRHVFINLDADLISPDKDIAFSLSAVGIGVDVVRIALDQGLIDMNKKFEKMRKGSRMLDNAKRSKNDALVKFLTQRGAKSGKTRSRLLAWLK